MSKKGGSWHRRMLIDLGPREKEAPPVDLTAEPYEEESVFIPTGRQTTRPTPETPPPATAAAAPSSEAPSTALGRLTTQRPQSTSPAEIADKGTNPSPGPGSHPPPKGGWSRCE